MHGDNQNQNDQNQNNQSQHPGGPQTQTQTIAEARELLAVAQRSVEGLRAAAQRLPAELGDERAWLAVAARRVELDARELQAAMPAAIALPEFEAERRARAQALFEVWVDSVEALLIGLSSHVSSNSPLIEVLFPHQKLDRLRRGGAAARAYLAELERRRRSAYIVRLSGEPEYSFLPALLARFDDAKRAFDQHEEPVSLSPAELDASRRSLFALADAVRGALQQARLLAEAALSRFPDWFGELALDVRPKKRSSRSATDAG